jgi:hypothetical protein
LYELSLSQNEIEHQSHNDHEKASDSDAASDNEESEHLVAFTRQSNKLLPLLDQPSSICLSLLTDARDYQTLNDGFNDSPFHVDDDRDVFFTRQSTRSLAPQSRVSRLEQHFHGSCVDRGAQRSVIGISQARAYFRFMAGDSPFKLQPSSSAFRFGRDRQESLGTMAIRFPLGEDRFFETLLDVVAANAPLLLGLDLLDD